MEALCDKIAYTRTQYATVTGPPGSRALSLLQHYSDLHVAKDSVLRLQIAEIILVELGHVGLTANPINLSPKP
jgi:hypothetical protein